MVDNTVLPVSELETEGVILLGHQIKGPPEQRRVVSQVNDSYTTIAQHFATIYYNYIYIAVITVKATHTSNWPKHHTQQFQLLNHIIPAPCRENTGHRHRDDVPTSIPVKYTYV